MSQDSITSYIPRQLVRWALENPQSSPAGQEWNFEAAVLLADISGFTPMSEALAKTGKEGSEELNHILSAYFTAMIDLVHSFGGDVIKFSGDAITCLWRAQTDLLGQATEQALACALAMQARMADFSQVQTLGGCFELKARVGVSAGKFMALILGTPEEELRYVLVGAPLETVSKVKDLAQIGQVSIDTTALETIRPKVALRDEQTGLAVVTAIVGGARAPHPDTKFYNRMAGAQADSALARLSSLIPPVIRERLRAGQRGFIGEHRRVTPMFVNFHGLDYNDPQIGQKLQHYYMLMQRLIRTHGGLLNEIEIGDKGSVLVAIFGAPLAYENQAERAVRCALALQAALAELPYSVAQRIGITTGDLFVGNVGSTERQIYTAIGSEMNLAARLMESAEWGQALVSKRIWTQTSPRFEYAPLGEINVKGKAEAVPIYAAQKEKLESDELVIRYLLHESLLVGRAQELERIRQVIQNVVAGRGQVMSIHGEAGVGKSRLVSELARYWLASGGVGYGGDCLSYSQDVPYSPWGELLRGAFGATFHKERARQIQQVEKGLRLIEEERQQAPGFRAAPLPAWLPLLSDVMGLGVPNNDTTQYLDAKRRQQNTQSMIWEILLYWAQKQPLLLLFEDVHWMDPLSWELVGFVARKLSNYPILLVLVHRPLDERAPHIHRSIISLAQHTDIELTELSPKESLALARSRLQVTELPQAVEALLLGKGQGNPFFTEELVHTLLETKLVACQDGVCTMLGNLEAVNIPDTVQEVVMSRIDRLDESSKLTIKVASVIGRIFAYETLREIYPLSITEALLQANLATLVRLDLTPLERPEPQWEYIFKHAITRDVAYESLLYAQRRSLHRRVAEHLEKQYADRLEEHYERLAHHFFLAQEWEPAYHYLIQAGNKACGIFANQDALTFYRQAEQVALTLNRPDWVALAQKEMGQIHHKMSQFDQALTCYDEARRYYEQQGDLVQTARLHLFTGGTYYYMNDLAMAQKHGQAGLAGLQACAESADKDEKAAHLYRFMADLYWRLGNTQEAFVSCQLALELAARLEKKTGHLETSIYHALGIITCSTGQLQACIPYYQHAIEIAERENDLGTLEFLYNDLGEVKYLQQEFAEAMELYHKSLEILFKIGSYWGMAYTHINLALTYRDLGKLAEAEKHLGEAISVAANTNPTQTVIARVNLGNVYQRQGRWEAAAHCYEQAARAADEIGDGRLQAFVTNAQGEWHLQQNGWDQAIYYLEKARDHHLATPCPPGSLSGIYTSLEHTYRNLAAAHLARGERETAERYLQLAKENRWPVGP